MGGRRSLARQLIDRNMADLYDTFSLDSIKMTSDGQAMLKIAETLEINAFVRL